MVFVAIGVLERTEDSQQKEGCIVINHGIRNSEK